MLKQTSKENLLISCSNAFDIHVCLCRCSTLPPRDELTSTLALQGATRVHAHMLQNVPKAAI